MRLTFWSISEAKDGLRGGFSVVDFVLTFCLFMYWLCKRVGLVRLSTLSKDLLVQIKSVFAHVTDSKPVFHSLELCISALILTYLSLIEGLVWLKCH